jgi:Synergist-CTERM protein sorting domain-containing protein
LNFTDPAGNGGNGGGGGCTVGCSPAFLLLVTPMALIALRRRKLNP